MKTIHEVKNGLECCLGQYSASCGKCTYSNDGKDCGRNGVQIMKDALVYIQTLESSYSQVSKALCGKENATLEEVLQAVSQAKAELAAVKRDRDTALYDMKRSQGCICNICKSYYRPDPAVRHYECKIFGKFSEIYENDEGRPFFCGRFEWRGVCPENTEV